MKSLFMFIGIVLIPVFASSQSTDISTLFLNNVKKGDLLFSYPAYRNALEAYLAAFEHNPDNDHVLEQIAICYVKLHNAKEAERYYAILMKRPDLRPELKLRFADVLLMNGKYTDAQAWLEQYLKSKPTDGVAKSKLSFLKELNKYAEDNHRFVISNCDFNTIHADFGTVYFKDGVVFCSSSDRDLFIKHKPFDAAEKGESFMHLYFVPRSITGAFGQLTPFQKEDLKSPYHEGPIAFYNDQKKIAFTESNKRGDKLIYDANGRVNLKIFFAEFLEGGKLTGHTPFVFNNDGYSTFHPSLTADGKTLFFASNSPLGKGGSDIYYSTLVNGTWSDPVNVGNTINSHEDELYPFIANDTTLYFSSNGHGTLGGIDVYVSYKRDGVFGKPINLGAPINSQYDDFSFVSDSTGRVGFYSSNRPGGKGLDDVYFYIANYYFLAGQVRELSKEQFPLANVKITVMNGNGDVIDSTMSDADGNFGLNLPFEQDFKIRGEKEGYETLDEIAFTTRNKPYGIDSLMLPMWPQRLFAKGRVISQETKKVIPGARVILKNLTDCKTEQMVIDEKGTYTFLVRPNKQYHIEADNVGYLSKGFDLNTKGLIEGDLLNDIVLEEAYAEKEVTYFAFDKSELTVESRSTLDAFATRALNQPATFISISGHADARGNSKYNLNLSIKRANAVVQYLVSKGIDKSRIQPKGYGETMLVNKCSDGVVCPEEDHSKNRRAEVKIQDKK